MQVRDLTGIPDTTVRAAMKQLGIDFALVKRPDELQQLRSARVIEPNTAKVAVMLISKAVKLLKHFQVRSRTIAAVKAIRTDEPPPIATAKMSGSAPAPNIQIPHLPVLSGPGGSFPRPAFGQAISSLRWGSTTPSTPPGPRQYVFPATMPRIVLTTSQETEQYGLDKARMSATLQEEVRAFKEWSSAPINTLRTNTYATASSAATLEKVGACVRAFLGYVSKYYHVPASYLSISEYKDPSRVMHFVAYLNARRARKGHILNHLSIARKINVYLASQLPEESPELPHAGAMDAWLGTLIHQYNLSERNPVKTNFPEATALWVWSDGLTDLALFSIDLDFGESGQMGPVSARFVQEAIIASLVTGRELSPFRLDFVKNVLHPRHNDHAPCSDRDCREPLNCIGNRVELRAPRVQVSSVRIAFVYIPESVPGYLQIPYPLRTLPAEVRRGYGHLGALRVSNHRCGFPRGARQDGQAWQLRPAGRRPATWQPHQAAAGAHQSGTGCPDGLRTRSGGSCNTLVRFRRPPALQQLHL